MRYWARKVLRLNAEELAAEEQSKRKNKNSAAQAVSDAEMRRHGARAVDYSYALSDRFCNRAISSTPYFHFDHHLSAPQVGLPINYFLQGGFDSNGISPWRP